MDSKKASEQVGPLGSKSPSAFLHIAGHRPGLERQTADSRQLRTKEMSGSGMAHQVGVMLVRRLQFLLNSPARSGHPLA